MHRPKFTLFTASPAPDPGPQGVHHITPSAVQDFVLLLKAPTGYLKSPGYLRLYGQKVCYSMAPKHTKKRTVATETGTLTAVVGSELLDTAYKL